LKKRRTIITAVVFNVALWGTAAAQYVMAGDDVVSPIRVMGIAFVVAAVAGGISWAVTSRR
ncbi:MAG: hypothetical protein ACYC6Y_24490, partial [Thermoguttaceae bacterium]